MQSDASSTLRRDARLAAVSLLILGGLWMGLRLYWQGLVLVLVGAAVGVVGWRRAQQRGQEGGATLDVAGRAEEADESSPKAPTAPRTTIERAPRAGSRQRGTGRQGGKRRRKR